MIMLYLIGILLSLLYVGQRMWILLPGSILVRTLIVVLYMLGMVGLVCSFVWGREFSSFLAGLLHRFSTSWLIVHLYTLMLLVGLDVIRVLLPFARPMLRHSLPASAICALALVGIFVYASWKYHHKERIALEIKINKPLPRPLKIVALSDLHLGYSIGTKELEQWIEAIHSEQPDIVLIAGDIVDGDTRPLMEQEVYKTLSKLHAPLGVYASLGNHEYYGGEAQERAFLSATPIQLLQDRSVLVDNALYIVGRDDKTNLRRTSLPELVAPLDSTLPIILLDHQPYHLEEANQNGIDLQLSGHTHEGQVFPINLIVRRLYEQAHGYLRKGDTHYYISSGMGIWGGKFRIGTQSEYAVISLVSDTYTTQ